ncbi:deoxycytidylate deaminase [Neodiprion lecontei]|uniref:Probable deoxycytidylate deaminase n=1 Tax=Neodiprion lecontei TaxID=441921 RepID=A0A6J0BTW1_NEOLC|nr:deoxycytidylate deaminase [Neodiprion lecontei]
MDRTNETAQNGSSGFSEERDINRKRTDYLEWDEYFMATAFLAAKRSKDPCTQVGVCIVNRNNKVVGVGYNGMPIGCSDNEFPWAKNSANKLETKHLYVCHAEMNAILNKNSADVEDCRMYVGLFPCNECAKVIIQSGIKSVVYMSDKYSQKITTIAAKRMFDASGVRYRQYIPQNKQIVIDFSEINWNEMTQEPQTPSPVKNSLTD